MGNFLGQYRVCQKQNFKLLGNKTLGKSYSETATGYSLLPHLDAQECRVFLRHPADLPEDATCPLAITDKTDRTDSKECFKITSPFLPKSLGKPKLQALHIKKLFNSNRV